MVDREKLIKAWEIFRDSNPYEICSGREFRAIKEPEYCMGQMIEDTIAILKEKKEVKPKKSFHKFPDYVAFDFECTECRAPMVDGQPYCMGCGRKVKWNA